MLNISREKHVRILPHPCQPSLSKKSATSVLILLGAIAGICLITTIVLAICYSIERSKINDLPTINESSVENNDLCLTPYCIKAANDLLESIDETIDPCENFYEFACGSKMKKIKIPSDSSVQGTFKKLEDQVNDALVDILSSSSVNETTESQAIVNARRLYDSCVNEEAIEAAGVDELLSFVDTELGGWPILQGSTWNESTFDFSRLLLKLNQHNNFIFYNIQTTVDALNSSINCIKIGQGSLGLDDRNYYVKENKDTEAYRQYMRDLAHALTSDTSMIDEDVDAMYEFEKDIAQYHSTSAEKYDGHGSYISLNDLSHTIDTGFDFTDHLRRLYLLGNVTLTDQDNVLVSELEFLHEVTLIIYEQSPRNIQNYMIWRFMMSRIWNMPKRFRLIEQQFNKIFYGIKIEPSRAITCANYVNQKMERVISKLYINQYFDKTIRNQSLEMIDYIRNALIDIVNQSTWMDSDSKNKSIEKIKTMNDKVGYPDSLDRDNVIILEKYYAEFKFSSSLIQNVWIALRLDAKKGFRKLRELVDPKAWMQSSPTDVNFYYIPTLNDIMFPAVVLQPPLFHKDAPRYLNYGGIGMFMGHEITHAFDSLLHDYDKNGTFIPGWTNSTIDAFNKRKQCINKQYNNYTVTQVNLQVNGEQTRNENIADIGGLKEAFFAYQKWAQTHKNVDKKLPGLGNYSAEQMFFINFGHVLCSKTTDQRVKHEVLIDEHAPPQFRVLGSTSNFVEFDQAFNCKPGQGNSRVNKCSVW